MLSNVEEVTELKQQVNANALTLGFRSLQQCKAWRVIILLLHEPANDLTCFSSEFGSSRLPDIWHLATLRVLQGL